MSSDKTAATPAAPGESKGAETTGQSSAPQRLPEISNLDIMRAAGLSEEAISAVEKQIQPQEPPQNTETTEQELSGTEEQPPAEKTQEETEADKGEENQELETAADEPHAQEREPAEPEADEEPDEAVKPNWYQKRRAKWSRQKERLQDEIDNLKEQVERKAKIGDEPTPAASTNPYSQIETMSELEKTVEMQRAVRDWCLEHPDGEVVNEGKTDEKVITPEEVRKTLVGATRMLEDAPRKAQEITARQQWRALATEEWPELFDKQSEIYQKSQEFLSANPEIARNPNRDFILGLMVEGWKTFKPRMEAKIKGAQPAAAANNGNGNGAAPPKKETLPQALNRKIPPLTKQPAPNPPRGSRAPNPQVEAAAAVERVVREGASPESIMDAIAAIERQNAVSGGTKRTPAPV